MMYNQNVLTYCKTIYMISWNAFYNLIELFPSFKLISPILSESCPHANRLLNLKQKQHKVALLLSILFPGSLSQFDLVLKLETVLCELDGA